MILGDIFGRPVLGADQTYLGHAIDARLTAGVDENGQCLPEELFGLIISPHSSTSFLGYERETTRAPWAIALFMRWHHRGTFLIRWPDIASIDEKYIHLRAGHQRYSAALPPDARRRHQETRDPRPS